MIEPIRADKDRQSAVRLPSSQAINKSYHHVRSFGKDLSNIQHQTQDSKSALRD